MSPTRAAAVSAQTVTVPTGPQPSPITAAGPTGTTGYGFLPPQGASQAPAQVPGGISHPVPVPSTSQQAEQSSAVAAAGAVPADAVGAHRAAAVMATTARAASPTGPAQVVDSDAQETITVPTTPSAATAIPTTASWSSAPPSLQDSGRIPRARGA
ncbi:DNA polymerase III subunit gamma/tau [Actinomyces oris]|uniref:DNA polymerase III subunit gamma/tau n=1 Tax=Actinomyces oris TaxID=544580 RepID=A0A1Q8VRT5_9ACTO|nr:DNA polymerase III subunit gamma/tau [Actinomyces oris]